MAEVQLLDGATGDTTGTSVRRSAPFVVSGLFKYEKTGGAGTTTLNLVDTRSGATVASFSVGSSNPDAAILEVALPNTYRAETTGSSGTFSLDVWVDGDGE